MSKSLNPVFKTTPDTHSAANGHWDTVTWVEWVEPDSVINESSPASRLTFQNGPIKEHGVNGIQIEDVLKVCLARTKMLNKSFPCRDNALSITKLQEAIFWQQERTARRTLQGVEGYDKPNLDEDVA